MIHIVSFGINPAPEAIRLKSSIPHAEVLKVSYTDPQASAWMTARLGAYLRNREPGRRIVVVCLGTDRSTGDSLGPLSGTLLSRYRSSSFDLFGTLEDPVHAMNLDDTMETIKREIRHPYIVGIDASLGKASSVGSVNVGEGPIRPGAGVNKELTPVGDIHISGVVNIGGFMEYYVLQNTRLHLVMRMADLISHSFWKAVNGL
jgi:putative sporulation protein YyaC